MSRGGPIFGEIVRCEVTYKKGVLIDSRSEGYALLVGSIRARFRLIDSSVRLFAPFPAVSIIIFIIVLIAVITLVVAITIIFTTRRHRQSTPPLP